MKFFIDESTGMDKAGSVKEVAVGVEGSGFQSLRYVPYFLNVEIVTDGPPPDHGHGNSLGQRKFGGDLPPDYNSGAKALAIPVYKVVELEFVSS